jgi:hypothetical protein
MFSLTVVAALWRVLPPIAANWVVPALGLATVFATNHPSFVTDWQKRTVFYEDMIAHVRAQDYQEGWMKLLCPDNTHWLEGDIDLLKAQKVGPFADDENAITKK